MYMKVVCTIFGLWSLLGLELMAQTPNISGKVLGRATEQDAAPEALPYAEVYWSGSAVGVTCDEEGNFSIRRLEGHTQLVARSLGFQPDTLELKAEQSQLEFSLLNTDPEIKVEIADRRMGSSFSRVDPMGIELINREELRKAACCNLSESFETNPSVDVSFSDAVTGTKQIRMLGLAGQYVAITNDNMPLLHGLASVEGLDLVPGAWINSIQIAKGAGSVVNGFEAMAGQINLCYRDPFDEERLHLNGYINQMGRLEGNAIGKLEINPYLSTNLLLHGSSMQQLNDRNGDGFLDVPLKENFSVMNRWRYRHDERGLVGQVNVSANVKRHEGGQVSFYQANDDNFLTNPFYAFNSDVTRYQAFAKGGYFNPINPLLSVGTQWMYLYHDQQARFGNQVYAGRQYGFYANVIGQLPLDSIYHQIKVGFSYQRDTYEESIRYLSGDSANFDRTESVPGLFAEYTYQPGPNLDVVAGVRSDLHNLYGNFLTPRLNIRWAVTPGTILRGAIGRGQRSANLLTDQLGLLASSRTVIFDENPTLPGYGFLPEVSWNMGVSLTQDFTLDFRFGQIRAEAYRTTFVQQVVVDRETPGQLNFYALNGQSFANSFLLEAKYELVKRLDVKLAYRYYDVQTKYNRGLLAAPFNPRHRGFVNMGYATRRYGWRFDGTLQIIGPQRLPETDEETPTFALVNAQINKELGKRWEIYLGSENVFDYRQSDPIISPDSPFEPEFDATLVWAPVFGRNIYAGFRFDVK